MGRLYAINTLGAVAGCLVAGFVLIEWLGLRGAELGTAAVNLVVGSVAWIVGRRSEIPLPSETRGEGRPGSESTPMTSERLVVLLAYSISGFAALGYEVAWVRLLTFFLGDSTYAFATMLGTFLFGLAAGAWVMARFTERFADPFRTFATIQLLLGLSMGLGLLFYPASPYLYGTLANLIPGSTWLEWLLLRFVVGFAVLLIPTLLMGASFPLAGRLYFSGTRRLGSEVGVLYAGNTVGAILGSLAVGFAVIPALGVRNSIVALIGLNAAIAMVVGFRARTGKTALAMGSVALVVAAILVIPADVFLIAVKRTF